MAKICLAGIIQSIKGSIGNLTFSSTRGIPYIKLKPKPHNPKTERQKEVRNNFAYIARQWKKLDIKEQSLWEAYANRLKRLNKANSASIIPTANRKLFMGVNAFMSVNHLLLSSGFKTLLLPPITDIKPALPPANDLRTGETYYGAEIKFKIWMPKEMEGNAVAQIWIAKAGSGNMRQLTIVTSISSEPKEVVIEKIRERVKGKVKELQLNKLAPCIFKIQMRTIAQNGRISMPSAIYKVQLK